MAPSSRHRGKHQSNAVKERFFSFKKLLNIYRNYPPFKVLNDCKFTGIIAIILIIFEIFINIVVIEKIPYTEIDWKAYMQEVEGVLNGTLDYENLKGDTGPLVYPAGFVYVFLLLYTVTQRGTNIYVAQYIFAALYIFTLLLVFRLYKKSKVVPPYALVFMCLTSYRIHSIYILRLFNDPVAVCIFFLAVNFFVDHKWTIGCALFSFAVSVKMNILLFAPGLFALLLLTAGLKGTILNIAVCAIVQIFVGLPFLLTNPVSYLSQSFNLGRVFLYEWTVNWRLIPEEIFVSGHFHVILLVLHLVVLLLFAHSWKKVFVINTSHGSKNIRSFLTINSVLLLLFSSNFIGMVFCRSLHYQFYVWYFFTLPYLLWSVKFNPVVKLCLLGFLELSWNTFPSTAISSAILHCCHLAILYGLYLSIPKGGVEKGTKIK